MKWANNVKNEKKKPWHLTLLHGTGANNEDFRIKFFFLMRNDETMDLSRDV